MAAQVDWRAARAAAGSAFREALAQSASGESGEMCSYIVRYDELDHLGSEVEKRRRVATVSRWVIRTRSLAAALIMMFDAVKREFNMDYYGIAADFWESDQTEGHEDITEGPRDALKIASEIASYTVAGEENPDWAFHFQLVRVGELVYLEQEMSKTKAARSD